ncbi:MAG: hypothetical protein ACJ8M1_15220 [Chthoniobacterales bacterium]
MPGSEASTAATAGIDLAAGATVIGLIGAAGSGIVLSGCVFFIWTAPSGLEGGSGRTVIRAVSFFGPAVEPGRFADTGADMGAGGAFGSSGAGAGAPAGAAVAVPLAVTGLPLNNGGGVTAFDGAGGKGAWAIGGRAAPPAELGGRMGPGRGGSGAPLLGGRAGMLMRTVSRPGAPAPAAAPPGRGGRVIRTVSFFGSGESAISHALNRFIIR